MSHTYYCRRMAATSAPVAVAERVFRRDVFQRRAAELGAPTIEKQAAGCGVSRQHLHKIFKGLHTPSIPTLDRMQVFLDLPIDDFYPRLPANSGRAA